MTYHDLENVFYQKRQDVTFPSSELEKLNEEERKNIEGRILRSCLEGRASFFQLLRHIKYYDLSEVFTVEEISKSDPNTQTRLLDVLIDVTHNMSYVDTLLELSKTTMGAFSTLVSLYGKGTIDASYLPKMVEICNEQTKNRIIYINMMKRVITYDTMLELGLKVSRRFTDEGAFNHDQELYSMLTGGKSSSSDDGYHKG